MKEFDLRPFEVKNKYANIFDIFIPIGEEFTNMNDMDLARDVQKEDVGTVVESLLHYERSLDPENVEIIIKSRKKEWLWEDIQVGWFFKCSDGDLYWKHEDSEFRSMGSKCNSLPGIEISHFFVLGTNLNPDPDLKGLIITNVYDCQELAKVLMIERIIT